MDSSGAEPICVYTSEKGLPETWRAAREVFREAAAAGLAAVVVTTAALEGKVMVKRRHDLKAALRTLGFTVQALQGGYTFQDEAALAKIEAITKAVEVLEREGVLLSRILGE